MLREQYSRANQRKQTTNYYLTYDSIITFYKMLLAFCVLCLSAVMGGQNRVFAQGAEVTDVLTAEKCGLAGNTYVKKEYTSGQVTYILNDVMKGSQTPNKGTFQLNSKKEKHSYIAVKSIGNGYTVKSVTIEVNNANGSLQILGAQDPYAKGNQQPVGTSLKNDIKETITYNFEGSYPYFEIYANEKTGAVYINSITVVWNTTGGGGSVETVAAPAINPASQNFTKAFDATITGAEGTTLKYTLDGSDPATSQTATAVEAATAIVNIPAQTTTLKAIALKGDLVSQVAEAVYTYRAPSDNDGTFAKLYTVEEFKFWKPTQEVWVVGEILGNAANGENNFNPNGTQKTNVCIGTAENNMPVKLAVDEFRALNLYAKKEAVLMVKGAKGIYFNRTGIEYPTQFYIADPTQALASINVKATEGYATYYNDKLGVTIPEGIDAKCGVITDVNNGALTIDYRYVAGTKIPAGNAVLVKAGKAMQIPLIVSKHTSNVIAENMLKGQATTGDFIADPDYKYYKLAYNNYNTKEGLGFYFGAENGGAFTVPAGMAYLAVPRSMAVKCFLLDGSATGIEGIEAGQTAEAVKTVYTLDGRKVEAQKLPKGIYIVNGKKVIVK